ncbi:hypothetical protein CGRA01v4_07276 [Colletotrichum graminicola]|nr:hypothetical protein CGRA01v4_07276 [Colletotrichum graminicola]
MKCNKGAARFFFLVSHAFSGRGNASLSASAERRERWSVPFAVLTATRGARCLSPLFVQHRIPIILWPFPPTNVMLCFSLPCPPSRHCPEPLIDYDNPGPYLPVTKTITGTPLLPSLAHNHPRHADQPLIKIEGQKKKENTEIGVEENPIFQCRERERKIVQ